MNFDPERIHVEQPGKTFPVIVFPSAESFGFAIVSGEESTIVSIGEIVDPRQRSLIKSLAKYAPGTLVTDGRILEDTGINSHALRQVSRDLRDSLGVDHRVVERSVPRTPRLGETRMPNGVRLHATVVFRGEPPVSR